jgi:hypothetical protein
MIRFTNFHQENPGIWRLFERFSLRAAQTRERYSAYAVLHRVRWEVEIETRDVDGLGLKVNNDFTPFYARLFRLAHPDRAGVFECRKLTTTERPARDQEQYIMRFNEADDEWIEAALRKLLEGND